MTRGHLHLALLAMACVLLLATACASEGNESGTAPSPAGPSLAPAPDAVFGLSRLARTEGERFVLQTVGGEIDFVTGVNLGPTVPGTQPGELAVARETWREWFPMIAETGFHAIRVYTPQPPHFYEELREFNLTNPDRPLYLVHGVWIPEEEFAASKNLFAPEVVEGFHRDIEGAVGVVHGDVVLPERPGYASGTYTADVSPWLISWAIGIEMDPELTFISDDRNAGRAPYRGRYASASPDASPTESWLAEGLDVLAGLEAERGITVPLTFSNWPTVDPLEHPTEPIPKEDLVGIDANHITLSDWPGGYYASYHAYPYYPDFIRFEPGIADFEHAGKVDPYAGYLNALKEHHAGMPLVVLESGIPSSIGSTHNGPLGRDQGDHSEQEAMAMNAELLRIQRDLGLGGGFLFEWADEWFKFTWNTIEFELPGNRRQLWHNPLTNESMFGLLAMDDAAAPGIVIDGDGSEWNAAPAQVIHEAREGVREIRAVKDASYLYLRLTTDRPGAWRSAPLQLGFDVAPGGNGGLPKAPGFGEDADTAIVIDGDEARAYVRASNDPNPFIYGLKHRFYRVDPADLAPEAGTWHEQRQIINRSYTVPVLGQKQAVEWFDLNPLRTGTSDPNSPDFDRRVLWAATGDTVELRIPYMMLGIADPSSRQALVVGSEGTLTTAAFERVGIDVALGSVRESTAGYGWEDWQSVAWTARPKAGFDTLAATVRELSAPRG